MPDEGQLTDEEREILKQAGRIMQKVRSPKKAAAARENGKAGGRPVGSVKPLLEIPCNCKGGDSLTVEAHPTSCPRGRAIRRRIKENKPLD